MLKTLSGITCVGAGKMGGALIEGWLGQGLDPSRLTVVDPAPSDAAKAAFARSGLRHLDTAPLRERAEVLVLAVKPQIMDSVLAGLGPHVGPGTLTLSIAAGTTLADLRRGIADPGPMIRAMPNTPAAIGRGMTVLVAGEGVSPAHREIASALMDAVGETAWIDDEALMDAVTAVSGSGPAYVFYLTECLAAAGERQGLPPETAAMLARRTVAGAGALLAASEEDAATLRRNVTSPGGTTEAALRVLMVEGGLGALMDEAVEAATRRGRELAG